MRVVPDSPSILLRAVQIQFLRVEELSIGPWETGPRRTESRHFELRGRIDEVLKGVVDEGVGAQVLVKGRQVRPAGGRDQSVPGVWSRITLQPGQRLAVFSTTSSKHVEAMLREDSILGVFPAESVRADIIHAMDAESSPGSLSKDLENLGEAGNDLTPVFGEYVMARLQENVLFKDVKGFDHVMSWVEGPTVSDSLRRFVVASLFSIILVSEPTAPGYGDRLAVGAFRILAQWPREPLASQLVNTYLPNLLGLEGGASQKSPEMIFSNDEDERARAREALKRQPDSQGRSELLIWIDS